MKEYSEIERLPSQNRYGNPNSTPWSYFSLIQTICNISLHDINIIKQEIEKICPSQITVMNPDGIYNKLKSYRGCRCLHICADWQVQPYYTWKYDIVVSAIPDEYFLVSSKDVDQKTICYKCDQVHGLIQCLKRIYSI
jgi:hypothetical protein